MFLVIGRTIKESFINFWRNGWLSVASVSVLTLSLYVVGALMMLLMVSSTVLSSVENRINVSVYFKADINEDRIMAVKSDLESYGEVKSVQYVSKEQALADFKKNNAGEPVILQSLDEIGSNPLLASLVVKANDSNQYQNITEYISKASFKDDVSRVNYVKNKEIIDRLNKMVGQARKVGLALAIVFAAVSVLIIFNTIRITIYIHKPEIEVMRLVGASNMFIRLPFLFEGVIYGVVSSIVATILLLITMRFVNLHISEAMLSQSLISFYFSQFWFILGTQLLVGIFLGIFSSWVAMRKYLKI
ncbi:MAG: permease-like cell division protein FtsX [Parcubacteria group bacterium]